MDFISDLQQTFQKHANQSNRLPMEAYMKNKFMFLGIKSVQRRQLLKEVTKRHIDEVSENPRKIVKELYNKVKREYHYCAMELMSKFLQKKFKIEDIVLIEDLISTHSHWDTVDFISKHVLGNYLIQFPDETEKVVKKMSDSDNIWLNRSAILFQLGYKYKTNSDILFYECNKHAGSKEFFIQKAIGWALREYAKSNPEAVKAFVKSNELAPLSTREALKHFK